MSKFTVIIPTIWQSIRIVKLVDELSMCDIIDEIIIIDNDPSKKISLNTSKVIFITNQENIYVNSSWNIGVEKSKNNLIAICNDDINFDVSDIFKYVNQFQDKLGCIGIDYESFKSQSNQNQISIGCDIGWGWGCLIFLKKENWIPIPNEIKILCGDNWISNTHDFVYKLRTKTKINTEMSTSSSKDEFKKICDRDIILWPDILSRYIMKEEFIVEKNELINYLSNF
jgi:hypothetical protein